MTVSHATTSIGIDQVNHQVNRSQLATLGLAGATRLPSPNRSGMTRVLHALILVCVLFQLLGSNFLSRPLPGEVPEISMVLHQYVGMGSLAVVAAFWAWTLVRNGETSAVRLVPWLSMTGIKSVWDDTVTQIGRLTRGTMPDDTDSAMISAVHGLGLLTLTAMAITGTAYFFLGTTPTGRLVLSLHKLTANLMWGYLIAHAGLAVLHQLLGNDMVSRMFWRRITTKS